MIILQMRLIDVLGCDIPRRRLPHPPQRDVRVVNVGLLSGVWSMFKTIRWDNASAALSLHHDGAVGVSLSGWTLSHWRT